MAEGQEVQAGHFDGLLMGVYFKCAKLTKTNFPLAFSHALFGVVTYYYYYYYVSLKITHNLEHLPYILESNPHPNLIRTSFCRFLKRKKS